MSLLGNIFRSTIGRKFLMAVTGVVLIGFVIGHLVGNLQIFEAPDKINGYSHFLQSLGPGLWTARIFLLICVVIHIWASVVLTIESRRARGPEGWAKKTWLQATFQSRAMRWTGVVVLAFLLYHLAHFTFGVVQTASYKESLNHYFMQSDYHVMGFTAVGRGEEVLDVYSMVVLGFQNPVVDLFYIIAVGLLSVHLLHGAESLFQTLGWRNGRWGQGLRVLVTIFCVAYFLGNLAIPASVLTGMIKPRATMTAPSAIPVPAANR